MADEVKGAEGAEATTTDTPGTKKKMSKKKKRWTIVGVVVAVIVVCGCGMWVWHGNPTFCNNVVCHDSMDPYVESYYATPGQPAKDKWGNDVSNSNAMLATVHAQQGKTCLDCHVPDTSQQLSEVGETVSGNYYLPLDEQNQLSLRENAHQGSDSGRGDEFCMNDNCHQGLTREKLKEQTSNLSFNPHAWHHQEDQCTDCHKSHRASTITCTKCHEDAKKILPDGWVDANTSEQEHQAIYQKQ